MSSWISKDHTIYADGWNALRLSIAGWLCLLVCPVSARPVSGQDPVPPQDPTAAIVENTAADENASAAIDQGSDTGQQADSASASSAQQHVIVVLGAEGSDEYSGVFPAWATAWQQMAERQQWTFQQIPVDSTLAIDSAGSDDKPTAKQSLQSAIRSAPPGERLWLVFLGHGTFARNVAKFNLQGPDVSAGELKTWLAEVESQVVVINCSSASAPFLTELAAPNRIVVTATQSGAEYNFARFGQYLSEAINDASLDLDHDQEISLLEAFLAAYSNTQRFYQDEARLATEHALINDNGDKVGTPGDFYRGPRPVKKSAGGEIDGNVASRIIMLRSPEAAVFNPEAEQQRAEIEEGISDLRAKKSLLDEDDYFDQLEVLLLQLADLYQQVETSAPTAAE
ncbi:MAG: hypothetical protein NXI32_23775 [bacterium]|nr:hypothetical protein [bacterium]